MERILTPKVAPDLENFFAKIFDTAFGVPLVFVEVPTADDLEPNTWGKYGNKIYIKFADGTALEFTGNVI